MPAILKHKHTRAAAYLIVIAIGTILQGQGQNRVVEHNSHGPVGHGLEGNEIISENSMALRVSRLYSRLTTEVKQSDDSTRQCPFPAVTRYQGLYQERSKQWKDIVLVTAGNDAYAHFLENWEYLARRLGLQWVVMAMDQALYRRLGDEDNNNTYHQNNEKRINRAILTRPEYTISGPQLFRHPRFNILSCNKLRMVLDIVTQCHVDVVFSDADNIFFQNPFEHDLGKMIVSRQFDYIYQANERLRKNHQPRKHSCLTRGKVPKVGNTGFYYLSRHSKTMQRVFQDALEMCESPNNKMDDQTLFWSALHKLIQSSVANNRTKWQYCNLSNFLSSSSLSSEQSSSEAKDITKLCCLDPHYYPTSGLSAKTVPASDLIVFHANYITGRYKKKELLMEVKGGINGTISGWNVDDDLRGWEQEYE